MMIILNDNRSNLKKRPFLSRGYSSRNIPNFRKCVYFKIVHIAYCHCAKDQIEYRTPEVLISRYKSLLYDYFDSFLIFKTPITQKSKTTCFANLWKR